MGDFCIFPILSCVYAAMLGMARISTDAVCVLGALAMESLHRQVLPFLLRRLKDEVLNDLPPKIIQDYYCELSQLQVCVPNLQT